MNPFLERFHAESNAFGRLKKLCESRVTRWDFLQWPDWDWDPEVMRSNQTFAKYQKRLSEEKAKYAYGYDKEDRVVVVRRGLPSEDNAIWNFFRYSGNRIVGSAFVGNTTSNVFEATLAEGRIVKVEHLMGNVRIWDWKLFQWEGDRIAKATYGFRGRKPHREIIYDKTGEVLEDIDLSRPIKRKPLPKGVSMNSLAKEIRERLAKAVIQTVAKAKIKETAYCLALNYDCEGNPLLPPELGIGLDSDRRAILKRGGRDAKLDIWDAVNFPMFASKRSALNDKDLNRACDLFNRELEYKGTDEPARKLILQVATDLSKVNWGGKLNTTDDFIVYAVDTDGADLKKNLKLCVPAKQLAKLKAAKLI